MTSPSLKEKQSLDTDFTTARLVVLTHYLPPYMARVLQHMSSEIPHLHVLLSIPLEPNRNYTLDWETLDVQVQKSIMLRRAWNHNAGFKDDLYVHLPYDTYRRLRRLRPDLIFSYELGFRSLASALYRRMHGRTRLAYCVCVSEHTESGRGKTRWLLRKLLVQMADAVTYNGPSCRQYLKRLGVPDEKLFPFAYAADDRTDPGPAHLERTAEPNRRLLVVGQLSERKGVLRLLDTLTEYCQKHPERTWDLTLVGTGPDQAAVLKRTIPDNFQVNVRGYLSPTELAAQWNEYGILIFPTLADEWGLVVNEAMRAGLPVIGSRFAQASMTLIEEGLNGWRYSVHAPKELFAILDRVSQMSASEWIAMRHAARTSVASITSRGVAADAIAMFRSLRTGMR